jgi:large subunit ribosomal protein L30
MKSPPDYLFNVLEYTMKETVTYTQIKSAIGSIKSVRATLTGLGLTRMYQTVTRKNTRELQGMLGKVQHLVRMEE